MGPFSDTVYTAGVWRVFRQVRMCDGPENVTLSVVNECPNASLPSGDLQKLHSANNDAVNWLGDQQTAMKALAE